VRIPSQQEEKSISAANGKASVKYDFHIIIIKVTWMQIFLFPIFLAVQMAPQINLYKNILHTYANQETTEIIISDI
jgi:hypothetical protein